MLEVVPGCLREGVNCLRKRCLLARSHAISLNPPRPFSREAFTANRSDVFGKICVVVVLF